MKFAMKRHRAAYALTAAVSAAATALLGGGGSAARAQDDDVPAGRPSDPFRVKIGTWIPSDRGGTRDLGYSFIAFGVGYDIRQTTRAMPNVYEVYFDYLKRPKTSNGIRTEAEMYGIGLTDRIYLTPRGGQSTYYVGAGAGIYHVRTNLRQTAGRASEYTTNLGAKFLGGAEFGRGLFGELEYNFVPAPKLAGERVRLTGTQLRLGIRF
jgi:hypothetical protein